MTRAGFPTTTAPAGTSWATTAPAPTKAFSPTTTPGRSVAFAPILAPVRMIGPMRCSLAPGDNGYFAFVKTTFGPIQQPSSSTRVLRDEHLGVDPDVVSNLDVMLDNRQGADAHVVADAVRFANVDLVAGLEVPTDYVPCVNHGVGPDERAITEARRQLTIAGTSRRRSQDAVVLHDRSCAQLDILIDSECLHEAIPKRHFLGRKRS